MHRVLPELIVESYRAGRYNGEFSAVGMFLDLSGFSTMTDALMEHGQHGAEVLAGLMHDVFDPLVESVFDYGGKVVGFAGDGVMALYPIESDARTTALRALTSACVIQKRFKENPVHQTVHGNFAVSAKIGLASGSVAWGILRSRAGDQATYYFRGSAVDDSAAAEHHARAGDILLTAGMAKFLQEEIYTTACDPFQRFTGFRFELPSPTRVTFPPVDLSVARLFMPEEVIAYDIRGEFRQIVNLFMRFPNLSESQLHYLMDIVFELRTKYGGLLNRLDFGDKGCNLLMLWGAPVAYENDIGRALNFLLDLKSQIAFPITAGVTYYIAHAGYLGSGMCEDYTCYGWGVNLASRFMMSAPSGETWVDDRIARRVSKRFDMEFIGSQVFKGFAARQKVHRLRGYRQAMEPIYQGELVGRAQELAQLAHFVEPLWQNKFAGLLLVCGEAGVGKGRLVYEFRSSRLFAGEKILWAVCQSDQILRQSFNPLCNWLLKYFGISSHQSLDQRRRVFDAKLDDLLACLPDRELADELDRTRSVLGALLDLYWNDSLYAQLDAEGRYNNTFLALIALLKAESLRQPIVVFLEDFQFVDNDTREFLPRFKRAVLTAGGTYPIALIVTTRPTGMILEEELIDARLVMQGLPREAVASLTETILGGVAAPGLVSLLLDRSEGNAYFVEQFLRYLKEENLIEMSREGWALVKRLQSSFLPGDIRSVLVARLDQLARNVRETIQTASILGREFELPVLLQMLRREENVQACVAEAEKQGIWVALTETRLLFSHGLLRDAAYEMQMQARREQLHAAAVDTLERLYSEDLRVHYAELAYHAEHARLRAQAQNYYTLAGKSAAEVYQNRQAIEYFTRALTFTPADGLGAQFDLRLDRVELFHRLADRTSQLQDLQALETLAQQLGDHVRLAKMLMLRTVYHYMIGDYLDAINAAVRAEALSAAIAETDLAFLAQTTWFLALLRLGRLDDSMQRARKTLEHVRGAGNRKEESRVLSAMGLIALEQREPSTAHGYLLEALQIARETKDRALESTALNNLALSEGAVKGNYAIAREYYEQSYAIARETGNRNAEGYALVNLGFVAGRQGDFVAAHAYHEQSLAVVRETGNRYYEAYALINLSAVTGIQNNASLALEYAQKAVELTQRTGERSGEAWALHYMGHAYLLTNDLPRAQDVFQKSVEIRRELGQPSLSMEPLAGLVKVALLMDNLPAASGEAEEILAYLEGGGTLDGTDEPLRIYHICFSFLEKQQDPRSMRVLQAAIQLLEAQASKFKDEQARKMYVENVPWRLALQEAACSLRE